MPLYLTSPKENSQLEFVAAVVDKMAEPTCDFISNPLSNSDNKRKESFPKRTKAFVIDWGEQKETNLQEAFLKFQKERQNEVRQTRKMKKRRKLKKNPARLNALRTKFIEQAKKYFGVPYARKYWPKESPEYKSPLFLDCCGLVRKVCRDLRKDLGFKIGPWNQAYMYDTLPISLPVKKMKPGDLVFMSGIYTNPKNKRQIHNMTHVEIWLGEGEKTIGARWNNGKVQVFDSYRFSAKSFHSEQYYFKSIDTWLMGICRSYCPKHPWRRSKFNPSKKSIFNPVSTQSDQNQPDEAASAEESEPGSRSSSSHDLQSSNDPSRSPAETPSSDSPNFLAVADEDEDEDDIDDLEEGGEDEDINLNVYLSSDSDDEEDEDADAEQEADCQDGGYEGFGDDYALSRTLNYEGHIDSYAEETVGSSEDHARDRTDCRLETDQSSNRRKRDEHSGHMMEGYPHGDAFVELDDDFDAGINYLHSSKSSECLTLKTPKPFKKLSSCSLPDFAYDDKSVWLPHMSVTELDENVAETDSLEPRDLVAESKARVIYFPDVEDKLNLSLDFDDAVFCITECCSESCVATPKLCEVDLTLVECDDTDTDGEVDYTEADVYVSRPDTSAEDQETKGLSDSFQGEEGNQTILVSDCLRGIPEGSEGKPTDADTTQSPDGSGQTDSSASSSGNSESSPSRGDGAGGRRDGDRSPGRGGGKKTPGGSKPTKLPSCSLANNMTPSFYIGGGNGVALVEAPLLALGWKRTADKYDERFRLKWVECKSRINYSAFREGDQLVNHIANCQLLTNKMGLLNSLQEYERVTLSTKGRLPRLKMSEFVPETYRLDNKDDRESFLQVYKDEEIWISKPTGMNQGKGIFLLRSKDEIEKLLSERDAKKQQSRSSTRPLMSRIVQRYIHKPLLLDERKFDIRAYMLIASTVPYLVLYHKGYIRLSCQKYDGEDTNLTTHLTNQFIQKKVPNYGEVKEDTAWSMDKFNDYINENVAPETGVEENWVYNTLTKQMQRIMLHCFNSVKHKLDCKVGYFDLYGLDFMVDTDMKVWLIEININPCLATNCSALKEVIPDIVQESIYLSLECFEKSRRNQALMPLNALKSFTVLYAGSNPNAVAPRQTRSVSPAKESYSGAKSSLHSPPGQRRGRSPARTVPRVSITTTPLTQSPYQPRRSEFTTILSSSAAASGKATSARVTRTAISLEVKSGSSGTTTKANSTNKNNSAAGATKTDAAKNGNSAKASDVPKPKTVFDTAKISNGTKASTDKTKTGTDKVSVVKNGKTETSSAKKENVKTHTKTLKPSPITDPKSEKTAKSDTENSKVEVQNSKSDITEKSSSESVESKETKSESPEADISKLQTGLSKDDVKLKMTHSSGSASRKNRPRADTGN